MTFLEFPYQRKRLGGVSDLALERQELAEEETRLVEMEIERLERFLKKARQPQFAGRFARQLLNAEAKLCELELQINGDPLSP